jgi:hypothetical protein
MPQGFKVEEVAQVSTEEGGDFITTALRVEGDKVLRVSFPARLGQTLLAALSAGISLSHRRLAGRLGSSHAVAEHLGITAFQATGFEVARTANEEGERVLVRLKKGDVPLIDFALPDADARALSRQLQAATEMRVPLRRRH